jgi:hypothetical protein
MPKSTKLTRILRHIQIFLVVYFCMISIHPCHAATMGEKNDYLAKLTRLASEKGLSQKRYWHLLLHYQKSLLGGYVSEATGPGFFLSPTGRNDPDSELQATLKYFFSEEPVGSSKQPAQCAFIARYEWLKSELSFDSTLLPEQNCKRFDAWFETLNPESITLLFPSAYMNNPSSLFGHTLLRIDQKGQTEQTRILDYTINYAADVTTENGILFAVLGTTGGFEGRFSTIPYYLKALEYGDFENRDIWEYKLNLSPEQIRRMLTHAWELGNTHFDYYFFKRNCSYELLSLLEVSDPELHLTDHFWIWTIPADTVRLLVDQPGLVQEATYRPARSTQIKWRMSHLSYRERRLLDRLLRDHSTPPAEILAPLPDERQVLVLDLASDYLLYRRLTDEKNADIYKRQERSVLKTRSRIKIQSKPLKVVPDVAPPEQGHDTKRMGIGFGWRGDGPFEEVAFRPAYHDLMDPETGYTPYAQIEAFHMKVRHYHHRDGTVLDRFTLLDIVSLFPIDTLFKKPSWKINAGVESYEDPMTGHRNYFDLAGGIGAGFQSRIIRRELWYLFADIDSNYGSVFEKNYRIGAGGTIGLIAGISKRWRLHLLATSIWYPLGVPSSDLTISLQQSYTIKKNLAIRFELNRREHQREVIANLNFYF